jgi:hypothetical protein
LCDDYYGKNASFIREGDIEGDTADLGMWGENWVLILEGKPLNPVAATQVVTSYSFQGF